MDEGQAGRRFDGQEALARMYPPTATWREGYYEGATEDDFPSDLGFEAKDVMIFQGAFRHSSCPHVLFALHGGLGPSGEAHGRCIGVVNGGAGHGAWGTDFHFGSSNWRRWEAAWKTTEDDLNAPLFVNWDY